MENWISLAKHLQKVLGDGIVHAGLVHMANLGMRLIAFCGGDKGIAKRHCSEHKGKSMKEATKPFISDEIVS